MADTASPHHPTSASSERQTGGRPLHLCDPPLTSEEPGLSHKLPAPTRIGPGSQDCPVHRTCSMSGYDLSRQQNYGIPLQESSLTTCTPPSSRPPSACVWPVGAGALAQSRCPPPVRAAPKGRGTPVPDGKHLFQQELLHLTLRDQISASICQPNATLAGLQTRRTARRPAPAGPHRNPCVDQPGGMLRGWGDTALARDGGFCPTLTALGRPELLKHRTRLSMGRLGSKGRKKNVP